MTAKKLLGILKNKYLLSFLAFSVWLIIFDQHNLIDRYKSRKHLNKLIQDTTYYNNKLIEDQKIIDQLNNDKDDLEKFARENYKMKADDEDVFIIVKKAEK